MTWSPLLLLIYGLIVGVSLGLTGGGGSIITVPLLVYAVGEPVHEAIATSLVIVGGTALLGFAGRIRQADPLSGLALGCIGFFGAVPGRLAAQYFSGRTLLLLFATIMVIAGVAMFRSKTYESGDRQRRNWLLVGLMGVLLGFLTGFLGIGGGFLIVPVLVLFLGMPMRGAIPTSLLVIGLNCLAGLLGSVFVHRSSDSIAAVDWKVALFFLVGGAVGGLAGAAIARRLDSRSLKRVFAVFLFCIGMFVVASVTGLIPLAVK
jgi:uncharacterized protein